METKIRQKQLETGVELALAKQVYEGGSNLVLMLTSPHIIDRTSPEASRHIPPTYYSELYNAITNTDDFARVAQFMLDEIDGPEDAIKLDRLLEELSKK